MHGTTRNELLRDAAKAAAKRQRENEPAGEPPASPRPMSLRAPALRAPRRALPRLQRQSRAALPAAHLLTLSAVLPCVSIVT